MLFKFQRVVHEAMCGEIKTELILINADQITSVEPHKHGSVIYVDNRDYLINKTPEQIVDYLEAYLVEDNETADLLLQMINCLESQYQTLAESDMLRPPPYAENIDEFPSDSEGPLYHSSYELQTVLARAKEFTERKLFI